MVSKYNFSILLLPTFRFELVQTREHCTVFSRKISF